MEKLIWTAAFAAVFVLALFVRVYRIGELPYGCLFLAAGYPERKLAAVCSYGNYTGSKPLYLRAQLSGSTHFPSVYAFLSAVSGKMKWKYLFSMEIPLAVLASLLILFNTFELPEIATVYITIQRLPEYRGSEVSLHNIPAVVQSFSLKMTEPIIRWMATLPCILSQFLLFC